MRGAWFMPVAMVALATHFDRARPPREFTTKQLLEWAPELRRLETVRLACKVLKEGGMLTVVDQSEPFANRNPTDAHWTLTESGLLACRAARTEFRTQAASRNRSQTMTALNKARPYPQALGPRLWNLLRIRRMLTSTEAAGVLADAGQNVQAISKQIGQHLSAWHKARPDAIEISAQRVGQNLRYVLVKEIGTKPPAVPARKGGAA